MSVRAKRRLLYSTSAGLLAATVGSGIYAIQSPDVKIPGRTTIAHKTPVDASPDVGTNRTDNLLAKMNVPLQRPLYDPPKPKVPKVVQQPVPRPKPVVTLKPVAPKVELSLLGTLIENDRAVAIVADATGAIDQKRIGDTLDLIPEGIVVEDIQSGEIVVSHRGTRLTLSVSTATPLTMEAGSTRNKRGKNKQRRNNR